MNESKHTPGPWSLEYDGGFETLVINSENGGICMMDCPTDEMEANGRLIAAAPDLLEVLDRCEERLATAVEKHFTAYVGDKELLTDVRAAIAKATGGK